MTTRVALLHNIISPHVVPLFQRLADESDIRLKVYFLAETDRNRRWETNLGQGFEYEVLSNWAIRVGRQDLFTFFVNPTIVQALLQDGFDVVVSVGWDSFAAIATFVLCKVMRKPFVLWSGSTVNEPSWRRTLTSGLVKSVVRGSASWIAYGSRARDYLVQMGAVRGSVHLAYNTVDVDWFSARADELRPRREQLRRELGLGSGPVVLYVGQLIARKGAADLVTAHEILTRRFPTAQLLLVGYGQLEADLRARVAQTGITGVHFAGHVGIPDLPRYYTAADVFVLPSREEVWGLVLNEAAASGLPLITTQNVGAAPDLVIPGKNGFIVPSGDPSALAEALERAIQARDPMGAVSRTVVARMNYAQNVEAILSAVESAVSLA